MPRGILNSTPKRALSPMVAHLRRWRVVGRADGPADGLLALPASRGSADILVCRAADFPVGWAGPRPRTSRSTDGQAGLETCETAGTNTCATRESITRLAVVAGPADGLLASPVRNGRGLDRLRLGGNLGPPDVELPSLSEGPRCIESRSGDDPAMMRDLRERVPPLDLPPLEGLASGGRSPHFNFNDRRQRTTSTGRSPAKTSIQDVCVPGQGIRSTLISSATLSSDGRWCHNARAGPEEDHPRCLR